MKRVSKFLLYLSLPLWVQTCLLEGCVSGDPAQPDPGSHLLESVAALQALPVGQGVSPASGYVPAGYATTYSRVDNGQIQFANGPWDDPVTVPVGTVIKGFGAALIDNGGVQPNSVRVELVSSTAGTLGSITSQASGSEQGWTSTFGNTHTTAAGELLWFRCSPLLSGGGGYATLSSTVESLSLWTAGKTLLLPFASFVGTNLFAYGGGLNGVEWTGSNAVFAPISLPAGSVVGAVRVVVRDNNNGPTTLSAQLRSLTESNIQGNTLASSNTSAGDGTLQTLTIPSTDTVMNKGSLYWLQVGDVTGTAGVIVYGAEVDYN